MKRREYPLRHNTLEASSISYHGNPKMLKSTYFCYAKILVFSKKGKPAIIGLAGLEPAIATL